MVSESTDFIGGRAGDELVREAGFVGRDIHLEAD
jgi:hypothetical protein